MYKEKFGQDTDIYYHYR